MALIDYGYRDFVAFYTVVTGSVWQGLDYLDHTTGGLCMV